MDENEIQQDAERLFKQSIEFVAGARDLSQIPFLNNLPEFAFVGRSNVGKSSLINAITSRKSLAKVSNTPGRTRQLNFFNLVNRLVLVDLPGYGYAKISASERKHWSDVIVKYLKGRVELRRIFLLIDSRHGLKDNDSKIMEILDDCGIAYQIVFTKLDKITKSDITKLREQTTALFNKHPAMYPEFIFTSSDTKEGIGELRYEITKTSCQ